MKLDDVNKVQEVEKRKWLEEIIRKFPEHDFSYIPMLTDDDESDREAVVENFKKHFKDRGIDVHVYNETKKYDGNAKNTYFSDIRSDYYIRGQKDEIIFIDPDKGFYQLNIDGYGRKFKIYLMLSDIHYYLMNVLSENSIIVVFQAVSSQRMEKGGNNNSQNVEEQLQKKADFMKEGGYLWYQSPNYTHPKLKFYFFSKKDWSGLLG